MKEKIKNYLKKSLPLFIFLIFFFSCFILTVSFVTKKSLFAYFNSSKQDTRSLASQKKSNLKMDFNEVKELLKLYVKKISLEKSPYYVTVKIPRGRQLCKHYSYFKLHFIANGVSINGEKPQIFVNGFCYFNKDVLTQIPLHYNSKKSFINYDLKTNPKKAFYTYEDWSLKEISFSKKDQSDSLSVSLEDNNVSFKL